MKIQALIQYMITSAHPEWRAFLTQELAKPYFEGILIKIQESESKGNRIFPPENLRFKVFSDLGPRQVKVIILGQDPYHQPGQAIGYSFAVPNSLSKIPPSLINIQKEIQADLRIFSVKEQSAQDNSSAKIIRNSDLRPWIDQGVFLLNTIMTVEESRPLSHQSWGWEQFTDQVIQYLACDPHPKVFILWGSNAHKKESLILDTQDANQSHLILKSVHPSPLSSYRGFFGSKPFSKTNEFLKSIGREEINWTLG
jgi:uracil-DNA glycosylase